jgi:urease accessory protein UreF
MDEVWENWAHAVFHSRILPAIREVTHHARHGRIREVIAADRCLDASLVAPLAVRSRAAGAIVAAHQQCPDGERILRRYLAAHRCARTPGHLAVVVAVRAAVFHLPEPMVLAAYLAAETKSLPSPLSWQRISSCMAQISESTSHLQAA